MTEHWPTRLAAPIVDGRNAGSAARAVGSESACHKGREFKRLFGMTPVAAADRGRARLAAG